jgi:membrane protein YqaA with SNARE-associated domain
MTKFTQKTENIYLSLTESMWGFCVPCQEVVCIFALLKLELDFAPCWFVLPAAWPSILGKLISYLQGKTGKLAGYHESGARGCKKWLMLLDWIIKVDLCHSGVA